METLVSSICNIVTAISTLITVFISLYYSHKAISRKKQLLITQQFSENFSENCIKLIITLENIGNTPIVLSKYGRTDGKHKNVIIVDDMNEYLSDKEDVVLIKPNEAKIIEYKKIFDDQLSKEVVQEWKKSKDYELLSRAKFYAEDTAGTMYPDTIFKILKKRMHD